MKQASGSRAKPKARRRAKVVLLSGGNPQIAKADGDGPVQAFIAAMPGWKRATASRLDALIVRSVPGVTKAVKWNSPMYGIEGQGFFLGIHSFTRFIKVAFFRGTSLRPVPPGASKSPGTRYVDIHEGELDEAQMATWVKQAAVVPGWEPAPTRSMKMATKPKTAGKTTGKAAAKPADKPASALISERIAELGDWRGDALARMRALIKEADPDVVEEWKWMGTPVWAHDGGICTGESYKSIVKLTFHKGASLKDPARLFNSSLDGNVRRAIDIHQGEQIDATAFKALIRAAVALNTSREKRPARGKKPAKRA